MYMKYSAWVHEPHAQMCCVLEAWNSDRGDPTGCELVGSLGCQGPIHYQTNGPTANNTSLMLTATPRRNYCIFGHASSAMYSRPKTRGCWCALVPSAPDKKQKVSEQGFVIRQPKRRAKLEKKNLEKLGKQGPWICKKRQTRAKRLGVWG